MHQKMAATLEKCVLEIRAIQTAARGAGTFERPRWPMIVLRSPKGWTGPKEVGGHKVENFWRAHQVPILDPVTNPTSLKLVEDWLRSYRPEELFDASGKLIPELRDLPPAGQRRISANLHANGGLLRKPLDLPRFQDYAVPVKSPAQDYVSPTATLATYLRDVMKRNMTSFRVFGPDETASNKLDGIYAASKKDVGGAIRAGRRGWNRDSPGRPGDGNAERAYARGLVRGIRTHRPPRLLLNLRVVRPCHRLHVQPACQVAGEVEEGARLAGTHIFDQPPDHVSGVASGSQRLYPPGPGLPRCSDQQESRRRAHLPAARCQLPVERCGSLSALKDYYNVIVADKQPHLTFLDMDAAVEHCTKGIGIWDWASTDAGAESDVVMACAGDVATMEALAATAILKKQFPDLKIRFVNVVDLFRLLPDTEHPHGLADRDFDSLFTLDKPVIFNFHSYPSLIHKLAYRRRNHDNFHVRGYKEKGNINTPMELAIINQIDRFNLAIDVIDRVPRLQKTAAHVKDSLQAQIVDQLNYAYAEGIDREAIRNWTWPG